MSAVRVRASGLEALRRRLAALPGTARGTAAPALVALAEEVAGEVRTSFSTGAEPSSPGAAPDDASGRLAAAVSAVPSDAGGSVMVSAPEAAFLEYGTVRMAARPFLRPAATRAGARGLDLLKAALRAGLRP